MIVSTDRLVTKAASTPATSETKKMCLPSSEVSAGDRPGTVLNRAAPTAWSTCSAVASARALDASASVSSLM